MIDLVEKQRNVTRDTKNMTDLNHYSKMQDSGSRQVLACQLEPELKLK